MTEPTKLQQLDTLLQEVQNANPTLEQALQTANELAPKLKTLRTYMETDFLQDYEQVQENHSILSQDELYNTLMDTLEEAQQIKQATQALLNILDPK